MPKKICPPALLWPKDFSAEVQNFLVHVAPCTDLESDSEQKILEKALSYRKVIGVENKMLIKGNTKVLMLVCIFKMKTEV